MSPLPKNLVVGGATTASLATLEIPGLSGSPDILPTGLQFSDEFDEDFAGPNSPWTEFSTVSVDTSTALSQLHLQSNVSNSNVCRGVYAPISLTYPATITIKLSDTEASNGLVGFCVSPVAPGNAGTGYGLFVQAVGSGSGNQTAVVNMSTLGLTGGGAVAGTPQNCPQYLRGVMSDSTHIQPQFSGGGLIYQNATAEVLSAAAAFICVWINTLNMTSGILDAMFDFVRIK